MLLAVALVTGALARPVSSQTLLDPELELTIVAQGLDRPTTMTFVGPTDILVLEKDTGLIRRVLDGVLLPDPVGVVPVDPTFERGLLGIVANSLDPPDVFLYASLAATPGGSAIGNRVYRTKWNPAAGVLTGGTLLLDLPATSSSENHNGGVLLLGVRGEFPGVGDGAVLYTVIGDQQRTGQLQNFSQDDPPDDTSVIYRILQDGSPAPGNPFTPWCSVTTTDTCADDSECPAGETCISEVAYYFAYGVRNSFGLGMDPFARRIWMTENGPNTYDEVNLVLPGFNSGWRKIMGPESRDPQGPSDLFDMPGSGSTYSDPELSWLEPIAVTAIVFPNSESLFPYAFSALVASHIEGAIYALPLNATRSGFDFSGLPGLDDLVADSDAERDLLKLGGGFKSITDLKMGPYGNLYVVAHSDGIIYRISRSPPPAKIPSASRAGWVALGVLLLAAAAALLRVRRQPAR